MKSAIDTQLVYRLVRTQFPQWSDLEIKPVALSGWDNKTFHLGQNMLVRLPSAQEYADQVEKEQKWLPRLAPYLPLSIPEPLAMGEPNNEYPWRWSIYRWLEGESAAEPFDKRAFAKQLAEFIKAFQEIDPSDGPAPGAHNFFRGGELSIYDGETRAALQALKTKINVRAAQKIWEDGLSTKWRKSPVWIHGDLSSGNLLIKNGQLKSVIDFGLLAVGDPACDLGIAWTYLEGESCTLFKDLLQLDEDTWVRSRAWVLWKALIVAANLSDTNAVAKAESWRIIDQLLKNDKRSS